MNKLVCERRVREGTYGCYTYHNCKLKAYKQPYGKWCVIHDPMNMAIEEQKREFYKARDKSLRRMARKINRHDPAILQKICDQIDLHDIVSATEILLNRRKINRE